MVYCNNCGNGNLDKERIYNEKDIWYKSRYTCRCGKVWVLDHFKYRELLNE